MPRAKAYKPEKVLNDAMQLFWTEGYETTSIPKLEEHLGINRFSIYDSFHSKRELFIRALDVYTTMLINTLVDPLEKGSGGLRDIEDFFSRFQKIFLNQRISRGCLLCNTATELGNRDQEIAKRVVDYFERVERAVFSCLLRARKLSELKGTDSMFRDRARLTRLSMQGVLIDLRLGRTAHELEPSLSALRSYLTSASAT
jgi:AcrR family transcriptional regulator